MTTTISKEDALISKNVVLAELNRMIEKNKEMYDKYKNGWGGTEEARRHSMIEIDKDAHTLIEVKEKIESLPVHPTVESGWISMEDQYPDTYSRVLTCDDKGFVCDSVRMPDYWETKGARNVVVWQPLPLPPKN